MDLPYFPSLSVVLLMSCKSLDTIMATNIPNSKRGLQPSQHWPGRQVETGQSLPVYDCTSRTMSCIISISSYEEFPATALMPMMFPPGLLLSQLMDPPSPF